MSLPKKKREKSRTRTQRSQYIKNQQRRILNSIHLVECFQCGEMKPSHIVCPECGAYKREKDPSVSDSVKKETKTVTKKEEKKEEKASTDTTKGKETEEKKEEKEEGETQAVIKEEKEITKEEVKKDEKAKEKTSEEKK